MKDTTNTIASALKGQFTLEGNTLVPKAGAYDTTLPETFGETAAEQAKGVHGHDKAYIPAFTKAAGEEAIDALAANKQFAHITAETLVGNTNVTVLVERNATVSAGPAKEGEKPKTREVAGYTTVRMNTKGGTEVKHVRDHIADLASKAL